MKDLAGAVDGAAGARNRVDAGVHVAHPDTMVRALALSVAQLGDRPVLQVLLKAFAVTLVLFTLGGVAGWALARALVDWLGLASAWGDVAGAAAVLLAILSAWVLFRAVAVAVVGVFADDVVEAVEERHFPDAQATARPISFARGVRMGIRSAARAIAVNLALLPVYVLLLVTGVGTAAAFFLANGWLLGRDLGDMVAVRHLPDAQLATWRRATRFERFTLGLLITALLLVPIVNLLAPVLGAAMATHLFHRKARR